MTTPTSKPGSSYEVTPLPSPRSCTFSSQRADFIKPVPVTLLPVYPDFRQDFDSDDGTAIIDRSTDSMVTPQRQKIGSSSVEDASLVYQDIDAMATAAQTASMHGLAEKSGINSASNLTNQITADLDRSPGKIVVKTRRKDHSNSFMSRIASFLGLWKKQERQLSFPNDITEELLPALSHTGKQKYSPLPFSLRCDLMKPGSASSAQNSLRSEDYRTKNIPVVVENDHKLPFDCATENEQLSHLGQAKESYSYPPPVRQWGLRHRRSRSLDIGPVLARSGRAHVKPSSHVSDPGSLIASAPSFDSRSRSMDGLSRHGPNLSVDSSLWLSSNLSPLSLPPNFVLVQVRAIGLDESGRRMVMGLDGSYKFKRARQIIDQEWKDEAINDSPSNTSTLDFATKKIKRGPTLGWFGFSRVKTVSKLDLQTRKENGMARETSYAKSVSQEAGVIPGQSFVGRVLETGSVVDKSFAARHDWVIGLVDIRKSDPLAEFIAIDWRYVHRVPAPYETTNVRGSLHDGKSMNDNQDIRTDEEKPRFASMTFDELALLPLCGIPAYRAVRTCIDAFPRDNCLTGGVDGTTSGYAHSALSQRRRALVLRGHDGVGAMAVQMLVRQGWSVSAHVPFSRVPWDATQAEADRFMFAIENHLKKWGVDEVVYDDGIRYANWDEEVDDRKAAVVRVIETLRGDGDVFDAVLDFVGGKEIREASERLLKLNGFPATNGVGLFTTLLGDSPDIPISTPDNFYPNSSTLTLRDPQSNEEEPSRPPQSEVKREVKYIWVNSGLFDKEIWDILGFVLQLAQNDGVRPQVEEVGGDIFGRRRLVSLERACDALVNGDLLSDGGTVLVQVAGCTNN